MLPIFSIGNLITFLAVLLILVIIRALDRNNRSLEKLKRFSDKISANIAALAEEKSAQIREFMIDLQGNLTAGKEMMARARTVEEALQARSAEVEGVRKRLLDYEKNFSDLASVSTRLDQTLKKLREHAEAADSVGRRIGETAGRLEKLEKRLPEIEAGSSARARQALETARAELVSAVETRVGALASTLNASEKRLKDFSAYMARLEAREEQAEKERAAYLSRSLEAFDADLNGRLSKARERGETLEGEVFAHLAARIREDEATFARSIETIEMRLADYQGDVDYRVKALEESSDIEALRVSLAESLQKMAASVRAEMKETAAGLVAEWQAEIAAATSAREQLHTGLAEVHAGLEELKTRAYQDVEKGLSVFEDEFFADLRERAAQALDKVEGFEGDLNARLSSSDESVKALGERMSSFEAGVVERMKTMAAELVAAWQEETAAAAGARQQVNAELEQLKSSAHRDLEKGLSVFEDQFFADLRQRSAQALDKVEGFEGDLKARISSSDETVKALGERVSSFETEVADRMKKMAAELVDGWQTETAAAASARQQLNAELEELKASAYQDVEKGLSVFEGQFFADLRQRAAQALDRYQLWQADIEKRMEAFESELKSRLASSDEAMQGLRDALRVEVEKTRKDSSLAIEKETAGLRETLDAAVRKGQREIETRLREMSVELETGRKDMADVLDASRAEVVAWEGRVRQQLSETEVSVAEKISRLASEAESSIGVVRDEFSSQKDEMLTVFTQERTAIKAELKDLGERISGFEGDLKRSAETAVQGIRTQMEKAGKGTAAALEKELAGVKEALESRSASMHGEIETRMEELATQLEAGRKEAAAQAESALGAIRSSFASQRDELMTASTAEREALKKQIAEMGERIGSFDAELSRTTDSTMEAIQVLRDALHEEVEKARGESSLAMEKDLASLRESLESASHRMQKEIETRMSSITAGMETNGKEVSQLLEASSKYVTAWEAKTRQRLSESEAAIARKVAAIEADAGSSVEAVRQAFAAQKEEFVAASSAESAEFRSQLAEVGQRVAALKAELSRSSEETLERLRGEAETLQAESQKRIRDFQADMETRIKDYRQLMTESREKAEGMQEKLVTKIDESYRLMSTNLADIDKRVKSFTAQTRLFERADSLRLTLEGGIEEMKKEIAKLGAEKAELAETELQLARTKKLADEVSQKLARFLAEKRRIDEMDGDFKKLLTLSRDIDLKVNTLSGSHDALQQIQAKVREFEEMGKVVETGVERLDKKQQIISVTAEGVDKNFQRLETMEKTIKETDQETVALEAKVRSLMVEYETLAGRKKDAETAMEISGRLNAVIEDLEQRLEKAQNSREWLARTETRFEEIGRQAQEQVRLLESIVKSETKKEKGDRGAPPMDKRETVVKLSHQGWSVQEISRVTQLSRGEVELILELAPKV